MPTRYFYPRPLRGGRLRKVRAKSIDNIFLSTPSARRATGRACCFQPASSYFYPRPLRGGRLYVDVAEAFDTVFLSTPSARRATRCPCGLHVLSHISIHALCEEGDSGGLPGGVRHGNFYPRPLRGGRRWSSNQPHNQTADFYPRPLRGGRPCQLGRIVDSAVISIHALCEEGDVQQVYWDCTHP